MTKVTSDSDKPYGIRTTLTEGNPMAAEHLLGRNWEAYRWYATAAERDEVMADMLAEHPWSRPGDKPAIRCEPVERGAQAA
ncbi:hypothetical protein J2T57_000029 [Natronocella acetinitrilica]|uniref:Uncharacterized protein n=1 Tax=Natronocella acetinitrilica TaxID=414046 RepID=A0AAE3KEC4_9GAMM|nr:hypothetical protein [Natronocella acetinitrilica]MCP1672937.1 hypothetical protein [Natronocella acetinitrilica]